MTVIQVACMIVLQKKKEGWLYEKNIFNNNYFFSNYFFWS